MTLVDPQGKGTTDGDTKHTRALLREHYGARAWPELHYLSSSDCFPPMAFYMHENRLSSRIRQRISLDMNNIPFSGLVSDVYIPYSVDFSSSAG